MTKAIWLAGVTAVATGSLVTASLGQVLVQPKVAVRPQVKVQVAPGVQAKPEPNVLILPDDLDIELPALEGMPELMATLKAMPLMTLDALPEFEALNMTSLAKIEPLQIMPLEFAFAEPPLPKPDPQTNAKPGSEEALYADASKQMDEGRWADAVTTFDRVVGMKGKKADAALYWKAYSLSKLDRKEESAAVCGQLRGDFPQSTWNRECLMMRARNGVDVVKLRELANAKSLSAQDWAKFDGGNFEVWGEGRGVGNGQEVRVFTKHGPTTTEDDIKILALNALIRQDPSKAMPLLRDLIHSDKPLAVRRQALFVLSRSKDPQAQQLLTEVATSKASPDLQKEAVEVLAVSRGKDASPTLVEVYKSSSDNQVKRAALNGLYIAHDAQKLVELARAEKDLNLKREIVSQLSVMKDPAATDYMMELLR